MGEASLFSLDVASSEVHAGHSSAVRPFRYYQLVDDTRLPIRAKRSSGGKNCHMVHTISERTKDKVEAPGRVGARPGNLRGAHLLTVTQRGTRVLGRHFDGANEVPVGTLTPLPRQYGREGGVFFEPVDLAVLVPPVACERNPLASLPAIVRPKGPIPDAIHRYLLS
jgi:hypothetical protein